MATIAALVVRVQADTADVMTNLPKAEAEFNKTAAAMTRASDAAKGRATPAFGALSGGLREVDKTFAAFGFSLERHVGMLDELGQLSGKTASQLGTLGTATSVAAAAFAGWNIGRWIADLTGADAQVANFTARLFNLGDVAAETAGAKMDTIRLAIQRGADATISYTDAIKFNIDWAKKHAESFDTVANRVAKWNAEINKIAAEGKLEQLRGDIEEQRGTLAELAKEYGVSERALQDFVREEREAAKAIEELTAAKKRAAAETEKLRKKEVELAEYMKTESVKAIQAVTHELTVAQGQRIGDAMGSLLQMHADAGRRAAELFGTAQISELDAQLSAMKAKYEADMQKADWYAMNMPMLNGMQRTAQEVRDLLTAEFDRSWNDIVAGANTLPTDVKPPMDGVAQVAQQTGQAIVLPFSTGFSRILSEASTWSHNLAQMILERRRELDAIEQAYKNAGIFVGPGPFGAAINPPTIRPFATGGIVTRPTIGLVGEAGPEAVIPLDRARGVGSTTIINVTVKGGIDGPGSAARRGREVADALAARHRQMGRSF